MKFNKTSMKRHAFAFLCGYAVLLIFLYANQRSFVYVPMAAQLSPSDYNLTGFDVVGVTPDDGIGEVYGWYHAAPSANAPTILYFHGNGGNLSHRTGRADVLAKAGYGVLMAGYRGYGGNTGTPSEQGLYADARAYVDWLRARGVRDDHIILYGESLGTGVATYIAAAYMPDAKALVLEAPYTSLVDLARPRFFFVPVDLLMRDRFDSERRISSVHIPILIIHGRKDSVVPFRYGQRLFAAATGDKFFHEFPDAGHNDLYLKGAWPIVRAFINNLPL